ncbi:PQQ-dependent catabolism-associated CXXCW motif protein [Poseidonocella sedimentorum]|uniref:PQQ-dependent catabolism-associated CXXCW motif protein n=1 Tax=Poseidonocella sedimentorum TaxID=871652 RepID=A0A1I6D3L6_9RHOB|nr:PQQ-dependent catabolism-associated CXXCW motif protein [Poseidonocella sedimentorum]SFR00074.1 PQQ-dependent catabolism-associated CXXCW motif protein [Poseidonocella sedimentorum]
MRWLAAALVCCWPVALLAQVPEPDAFRMEAYRAPVPATLAGAVVVDAPAAHELWRSGEVAFIDVLPRAPKPANLPEGTIWREKPRQSIPGAIWLPNVGYGALADETHAYFKAGLAAVTGGALSHPVLIFCLEDCWMSWNAAKRARAYGYDTVYWFPGGTDAWSFHDFPTEPLEPFDQ